MTRLERLELSKRRPYAREKPGSPTFLLHGQLSDRFLGRFIPKGSVPLPRSEGLLRVFVTSLLTPECIDGWMQVWARADPCSTRSIYRPSERHHATEWRVFFLRANYE